MTKYNLSKFNVKNNKSKSIMATVNIDLDVNLNNHLKIIDSGLITSKIKLENEIIAKVLKFASSKLEFIELDMQLDSSVFKFTNKTLSNIELETSSTSSLLGTDDIQLNNDLILKPGQILEIDLCDLTVTIDGENAIHILSDNSNWFDLLPGENEISINTNGKIETEIYWKDRWL